MSVSERERAIERRLASNTKGLGYWAAWDAKYGMKKKHEKKEDKK